jgi:hypothetical protein
MRTNADNRLRTENRAEGFAPDHVHAQPTQTRLTAK